MTWYASLTEFKLARFADIERRTVEVLARGYTYSGVTVSLSSSAVLKYQTLQGLGLGALLVSCTVEAADPLQAPLVLPALGSPSAFLSAVNTYLRSVYEDELTLKTAIRVATTTADVEAVVDAR